MSNVEEQLERFFNSIQVYDIPQYTKVRLGNNNDGGYVVAKEICENNKYLFSVGIGDDISFENDFLKLNPKANIYTFDPDGYNGKHNTIKIIKDGLKREDSYPLTRLINKVFCTCPTFIDGSHTIKIDAEGAEWYTLDRESFHTLENANQLVVEFHMLHSEYNGKHSPYFTTMYQELHDKLNLSIFAGYSNVMTYLNKHYTLYHIHGNNSLPKVTYKGYEFPPLLEMTFINNNIIKERTLSKEPFPLAIDQPNKTDRPDFESLFPFKAA